MATAPGRDFHLDRLRAFFTATLCLATWCVLVATSARGEGAAVGAAAGAVVAADTLVVRASAPIPPFAPATAAVVSRIDLTDADRARELGEVLGRTAGLQMRRLGGIGASAVPSLRGSSAGQIRILIDGIPLNDAQTGQFDLSRLPAERFGAAEIHRGSVPVGFGDGGIGAINLISRDDPAELSLRLRAGSFGELAGRAVWGAASRDGATAVQLTLHGRRADNDFAFTDHRYTFNRTDDDVRRVRQNAWFENRGGFARLRHAGGDLQTDLRLGLTRTDGGRPGPIGFESPHATVRYDRLDGAVGLGWRDGLLRLDLAASRGEEGLWDPEGEIQPVHIDATHSVDRDVFSRLTWAPSLLTAPLTVRLQSGLEARRQWFRIRFDEDEDPLRVRSSLTAFAAVDLGFFGDRLLLTPSWRWQRHEDNFPPLPFPPGRPEEIVHRVRDDVSPALGATWTVMPQRLFCEAHVAHAVRPPTWIELFGHRGGVLGNWLLVPERIASADVAVTAARLPGGLSLRLAAFTARTRDAMVYVQTSWNASRAENIGGSVTRGLELELAASPVGRLEATGNLTWQRARDDGDDPLYRDKRLPFLSDLEGALRLSWRDERWRPWCEAVWQSANYRDRANSESNKAPGRFLLDAGLARSWPCRWCGPAGRLTVEAVVANLTDNQVYDVEGFPLPGRSWRLAVGIGR